MVEIKSRDDMKHEKKSRDEMDDLVMWHRLGHFLRYLGAIVLIGAFGVFIMALAVHGGHLPTYTKGLLIALAVIGLAGIAGGNLAIAAVSVDPEWTGEDDENKKKRRQSK